MNNLSKELVEMQMLLRKYKVPQRSIDKIINREKSMKEEIEEFEQLIDIQDQREYHKRYLEERRKEEPNLLYPDYDEIYKRYYEQKDKINTVIDDMKHFHLIYNEDGKLISSDKGIFAEIRFFIDKLEGTVPTTMTPFEHDMWEKENKIEDKIEGNKIKEIPQFEGTLEQLDKLSIRGENND